MNFLLLSLVNQILVGQWQKEKGHLFLWHLLNYVTFLKWCDPAPALTDMVIKYFGHCRGEKITKVSETLRFFQQSLQENQFHHHLHHPNLINDQWSSKKDYQQHSDLTTSSSSSSAACWSDRSNQLKDQTVVSLTLLPFRQIEPDLGWGDWWIPPDCTIYICVHFTFVLISPFHTK